MDKVAAAPPYEADASAYLGDDVLAMGDEVLLGDGKVDEVGGYYRTWGDRDLQVSRNEAVAVGMDSLSGDHGVEAGHA